MRSVRACTDTLSVSLPQPCTEIAHGQPLVATIADTSGASNTASSSGQQPQPLQHYDDRLTIVCECCCRSVRASRAVCRAVPDAAQPAITRRGAATALAASVALLAGGPAQALLGFGEAAKKEYEDKTVRSCLLVLCTDVQDKWCALCVSPCGRAARTDEPRVSSAGKGDRRGGGRGRLPALETHPLGS